MLHKLYIYNNYIKSGVTSLINWTGPNQVMKYPEFYDFRWCITKKQNQKFKIQNSGSI